MYEKAEVWLQICECKEKKLAYFEKFMAIVQIAFLFNVFSFFAAKLIMH